MRSEGLTGAVFDRLTPRVLMIEANGESYWQRESKRRLKKKRTGEMHQPERPSDQVHPAAPASSSNDALAGTWEIPFDTQNRVTLHYGRVPHIYSATCRTIAPPFAQELIHSYLHLSNFNGCDWAKIEAHAKPWMVAVLKGHDIVPVDNECRVARISSPDRPRRRKWRKAV